MCLPPLILAAIATGLGGALTYAGQQKADHALTNTFNKGRATQQQLEAQQQDAFANSLKSTQQVADPAAEAAAAAKRDAVISSAIHPAAAPGSYLPGSGSAPAIVAADAKAQGAKSDARTSGLAAALASIGGVSDMMQNNNINIGRNNQNIGQLGSFMNGQLGVLQSKMDAAKQKGGNLRMLGGLAQSIGSAMLAGGAGAGGFSPMAVNTGADLSAAASLPGLTPQMAAALPGFAI